MKEDLMHPDDHDLRTRLKVLLDPPPPGLDAVGATANARRAHRRRRRVTVAAAAVLLLATGAVTGVAAGLVAPGHDPVDPAPPAAPPNYDRCEVQARAVPPGMMVTAADPSGTYLVGHRIGGTGVDPSRPADPGDPRLEPVVVRGGAVTPIPRPVAVAATHPKAVDKKGAVYGWAETTTDFLSSFPWVYRTGVTSRLPLPDGYTGAAVVGINAGGDVAGNMYRRRGTAVEQTGVVWPAATPDSPVVTTPGPGFDAVEVVGIADDGTVVGWAATSPQDRHSYAWRRDGTVRRLEEPAGAGWGRVYGTNGRWAYGHLRHEDGSASAARWNLVTGTVETFPGLSPDVAAISPGGVLVLNDPRDGRVYVVDAAGTAHQLPGPSTTAVAISDDGRTVSGSVVWSCG